MSMELDHVFLFTSAPGEAAGALQRFGLTEGTPNTHPGQGTACRRFFFRNAYLELLSVTSEEELRRPAIAATKLWERSQYQQTGYCPFGICFRSNTTVFEEGWHYQPPYLPGDRYINVAPNTNYPTEPMLFELPSANQAAKDYPPDKQQPLEHERGLQHLTQMKITLLTAKNLSPSLQKVINDNLVAVVEGMNYLIELEFDDAKKGQVQNFTSYIPLVIRW